jgi:predicted enzyme related to lactoylglutathione lyase
MPEFSSYPAGTPCWVDVASSDIDKTNSFYESIFGWKGEDQGGDAGHYMIYSKNGSTVAGGMSIMQEGQPAAWTSYVCVDDADATVASAKKEGAMVFVEPMDVMDIGRMAVFADPTGAAIGLWQPKSFIGAQLANETGAFSWNELQTRDVAAAKAFYAKVFGWEANDMEMDMGPGGKSTYTEWKLGDRSVAGMMPMPPMVPAEVPPHWLVYFGTDDTDATVSKATGQGATALVPPTDIPPGRFSILTDPTGAAFAVIKMNPMGG